MLLHQHFAPTKNPRGTVLIAHGYGEHHGRFHTLWEDLNHAGWDAISYDHYGHGEALGPRARVDVGQLITDHVQARRDALQIARTPDLVLFGHSMGGLIATASAEIDPTHITALVLTGPAFKPRPSAPMWLTRTMKPVARLLPWLPVARLHSQDIARDPAVVQSYLDDPAVYVGPVQALTGVTMTMQGRQTLDRAGKLHAPLLILQGEDDLIVDPSGAEELAASCNCTDVTLRIVDHAFHELLNDIEGPQLRSFIIDWLSRR